MMVDEGKENTTYIMGRILFVQVVQVTGNVGRLRPQPPSLRKVHNTLLPVQLIFQSQLLLEMPGQQTIKFALHEFHPDPVGNEIVPRETVPFLAHAKLKIKFLHRRKIDAWFVVFLCTRGVHGEKTSDVEKPWDFGGLELERDG